MKALLTFLLAVILIGCANEPRITGRGDDWGGLTNAQWKRYEERAADAVLNPVAWTKVGSKMPKGVQPSARSDLYRITNSPDAVRPPTRVSVHVPIGKSLKGCSVVVVDFSHPDGEITSMYATDVYY